MSDDTVEMVIGPAGMKMRMRDGSWLGLSDEFFEAHPQLETAGQILDWYDAEIRPQR